MCIYFHPASTISQYLNEKEHQGYRLVGVANLHHRLMMTIFGTLIFALVIFEISSVLLPENLEDGRADHKLELATTEKHSFANMGVDEKGYNLFCGYHMCDLARILNCISIMVNE